MPYNTRRKSLSLPALGIQLPQSHAARAAHRPSPASKAVPAAAESQAPPSKRLKRSHPSISPSPASPARAASKSVSFVEQRPRSSGRTAYEHTPPPSPGAHDDARIQLEAVHDDIVAGVIQQLEKTGNRPHLIKELAAVLSTTNDSVAGSANPAALLSSRLASYMRRPSFSSYGASIPCPLAKDLINVHPRKVFYYLTTTPHQSLPPNSHDILPLSTSPASADTLLNHHTHLQNTQIQISPVQHPLSAKGGKRIISPSLSNASIDEDGEAMDERKRAAMSPSPEIDLFATDLDAPSLPSGLDADYLLSPSTPGAASVSGRDATGDSANTRDLGLNSQSEPPPLEGDEREFTATARGLRERGMSLDQQTMSLLLQPSHSDKGKQRAEDLGPSSRQDESEEAQARRNSEAAAALFGSQPSSHHATHHHHPHLHHLAHHPATLPTSLHPSYMVDTRTAKIGSDPLVKGLADDASILGHDFGHAWAAGWGWAGDVRRPELVGIDELDEMFGAY